jgi:hypothetical protein
MAAGRPSRPTCIMLTLSLRFTPHSLRAITETLLLDAGVGIIKPTELPGRGQVTTTQICDKGRRSFKVGVSHDVPI